ncbi:endonuclease/exonuclease/phosphatase family protein [Streptomyces sp. URMC 129]|uniref:endonuclease/exonuclease/phosphatase family protein n=1 Tax=Streptomyces sp. URMC 129 TaxID=3423407 RepID=UPI003F1B91DF
MPNRISLYSPGRISLGADILVYYETDTPGNNRVCLYPEGSTGKNYRAFEYAPGRAGVVRFSGISTEKGKDSISPGRYTVKLIGIAEETVNCEKTEVILPLTTALSLELTHDPYFLVESFVSANVVVGQECSIKVGGILESFGRQVTFAKHSGDAWLDVSADGVISGTPPGEFAGRSGHIVVVAGVPGSGSGVGTSVAVTVPVRSAEATLVDQLRVATLNMWYDATIVRNGLGKVARVLLEQNVDIVALQEVHRYEHPAPGTVRRLAERLGWYYHEYPRIKSDAGEDKDIGVISRYPIDLDNSGYDEEFLRSEVTLGGLTVQVCCVHLAYWHYGPHAQRNGEKRFTTVVQKVEEASRCGHEMKEGILKKIKKYIAAADECPVIVLGDFNSPSHHDWVSEVTSKPLNYRATQVLERKGFQDSYRAVHPDPQAWPGATWSPTALWLADKREPRIEPQERIDFIFHRGKKLTVLDSRVHVTGVPAPAEEHPDWKTEPRRVWYNEWPSDHAAVITTYRVDPA